jgi:hypothetical protein
MMSLRAIGYWRGPLAIPEHSWHADPLAILETLGPRTPEPELLSYLRGGHVFEVWRGYSWCRFRCGVSSTALGHRDFTDGEWVWPEGLIHYVDVHRVALPDEFVATARARDGLVPPTTPHLETMTHDAKVAAFEGDFWDEWFDRLREGS